jgi:ribosomal protein S18 acetylase RimI-like enzyme
MMDDVNFILGLMRENTDALGFIPASTIESRYVAGAQYLLQANIYGKHVGYLLHGKPAPGGVLTIAQAVIDYDFRNRGHGEDVVTRLIERAQIANCRAIKLRCADDLTANGFWQAQGFELVNTLEVANRRQRLIHTYMLPLWSTLFGFAS